MSASNKISSVVTAAHTQCAESQGHHEGHAAKGRAAFPVTPFACPRDFLLNRFVYVAVSARARGLSIGVNMNPDRHCNFDCVYCEVDRRTPSRDKVLDMPVMVEELQRTLDFVRSGAIHQLAGYAGLPPELLELRHVALSGDGEPTLCPQFVEAVESVVHVRARGGIPFFKIVLITNGTGLDLEPVKKSLKLLTLTDEIWVKLDAGTQAYMDKVNRPQVSLEKILANILTLGRQRPVIIQSLFPMLDGKGPAESEIESCLERLQGLKAGGAVISLVQIYSATRPRAHAECGHLPLKSLSNIARLIRTNTGLRAEVF